MRAGFDAEDFHRERSGVEHVELLATEHHAGDEARRHLDSSRQFAVRAEARDFSAARDRRPHMPLSVNGAAVGHAAESFGFSEYASVRYAAGREVVVVGKDGADHAVGKIEGAIVGTPAWTIGTANSAVEFRALEIRVETVERSERFLEPRVHRAGDEASARIRFAVVESGV